MSQMINKTYVPLTLLSLMFLIISGCSDSKSSNDASSADKPVSQGDGFVSIFDGNSLTNWSSDGIHWDVENGNIVGRVTEDTPLEANTFLIYEGGELSDFELKVNFRITESGNSGIQYRSEMVDGVPYGLKGYQADIDGRVRYTGQNYEERKRATLAYRGQKVIVNSQEDASKSVRDNVQRNAWQSTQVVDSLGAAEELKAKIKFEDWNECHLIIKGNRLQHYINGILMSDVTDNDAVNRKATGLLGFQVHKGPPMKVEYKDVRLKVL